VSTPLHATLAELAERPRVMSFGGDGSAANPGLQINTLTAPAP
jgi:hypothetical protein